MVDHDLLAVSETIAIGIRIVWIGPVLKFLQIGKTVTIWILKRHGGIVGIEAMADGPGIRNTSMGRARQNDLNAHDALPAFIYGLDNCCAAAHSGNQTIRADRGN